MSIYFQAAVFTSLDLRLPPVARSTVATRAAAPKASTALFVKTVFSTAFIKRFSIIVANYIINILICLHPDGDEFYRLRLQSQLVILQGSHQLQDFQHVLYLSVEKVP